MTGVFAVHDYLDVLLAAVGPAHPLLHTSYYTCVDPDTVLVHTVPAALRSARIADSKSSSPGWAVAGSAHLVDTTWQRTLLASRL
jgi:hypothetical protein